MNVIVGVTVFFVLLALFSVQRTVGKILLIPSTVQETVDKGLFH
jgi:hypothetical protein